MENPKLLDSLKEKSQKRRQLLAQQVYASFILFKNSNPH